MQVETQFVPPIGDVANTLDAPLADLGWVALAPLQGRQIQSVSATGSVAHWTKRLRHGIQGDAYAYPVPHAHANGGQEMGIVRHC